MTNLEVIKAWYGSVKKWRRVAAGGSSAGAEDCAFCKLFKESSCVGCPIRDATKHRNCVNTPYEEWVYHHRSIHSNYGEGNLSIECNVCADLVNKELRFLVSLAK